MNQRTHNHPHWNPHVLFIVSCALVLVFDLVALVAPADAADLACDSGPIGSSIFFREGLAGNDVLKTSSTISVYLPFVYRGSACQSVPGATYGTVAVLSGATDRPAASHPDLNLALRSYKATVADLNLVDYDGETDPAVPQLPGLFLDNRAAKITGAYQVYDWIWPPGCDCRGSVLTDWPVTLAGLKVSQGEVIQAPSSGYDIGWMPDGYEAMVLYATASRITLTFTRNDNVAQGYAVHLENICVDPNLLDLYQRMNSAGRKQLPALYSKQAVGRAISSELGVAIRDTGSFLDPRSRKDWWQGK